jgi:PIN domain nuclease of toxin-antitoxin system
VARAVLDASAVLAALLREPISCDLSLLLNEPVMSAVNLCEVATKLIDRGMPGHQALALISTLSIAVESFTAADAIAAADLRVRTREVGLSLGDRACLALGQRLSVPIYTADRPWARLGLPLDIRLIR